MARLTIVPNLFAFAIFCVCGCARRVHPHGADATISVDNQPAGASDVKAASRKVVAKVLGREIVDADLEPPANDGGQIPDTGRQRYRQEILHQLIWQPLMEKYFVDHELHPTAQEIEQYRDTWDGDFLRDEQHLQELRAHVKSEELTEVERRDLAEQLKLLEADGPETGVERLIRYYQAKLVKDEMSEKEQRDCFVTQTRSISHGGLRSLMMKTRRAACDNGSSSLSATGAHEGSAEVKQVFPTAGSRNLSRSTASFGRGCGPDA